MIASQIGAIPNIGKQRRGSCADYNANNTWYFNSTNGCVNNNNRYNANFRSRPVLDYGLYDNGLLESYPITLSQMRQIARRAERGKRRKASYVFFALHRIEELVRLTHELNNFEVMPREGTAHIIFEPRIRQIVCASAPERVVQTFYIMQMQPYLERYLYHPDSYSCRPGKGGLRAVEQLRDYIFEATEGYTRDAWVVKRDIQAFFMHIDCFHVAAVVTAFIDRHMAQHPHRELLKYLTRVVYLAATKDHLKDMSRPDERCLLEPKKNIYCQPYYRGVPIGNWPSQTAGLIETSGALHYAESLGHRFVHYTDDTTYVVTDPARWHADDQRIANYYVAELGLTIHPKKRYMQHYSKGVELLGYKVRFGRILPSDRIYHNITWYVERTIRKAQGSKKYAFTYRDKILASVNSYLGLLRHMDSYKLRKRIGRAIEASPLSEVFDVATDFTKIAVKPQFTAKNVYKSHYKSLKKNLKTSLS